MAVNAEPHIPASTTLPEITGRSLLLGVILSAVLAGANAYLGLFAGLTVSASIPAAVISMAILRLFRDSNILENNIVQTAASAGESLAAGVIFTIPALVILGTWTEFEYWDITIIAGLGGLIGVLFTIPLRRALIVDNPLRFPEGVATAEVLKVGEHGGAGMKYLAMAGVIGALFKTGEAGFRLWGGALEQARFVGGTIAYVGTNLSPALVGVGYIVGLNIAIVIFIGGVLNYWLAIPIVAALQGMPDPASAVNSANAIWSAQTRYLGVGAMIVGGVWTLIRVRGSIASGVRSGIAAYRQSRDPGAAAILRTERDVPMQWVGIVLAASAVPVFIVFHQILHTWPVAAVMAIIMLIAGFLFSAVAGYMAGLVGSSNNPISGVTIATILTSSLLLLAFLGTGSAIGPAAAILIGAVVACAAAISGDTMQDLKAGRIVGATPFRQQIMEGVGVLAAAFVLAPVLTLLMNAYGIGAPTPAHPHPLTAPQATLMAAVAGGVFGGGLPWRMVAWGMAIAVIIIAIDTILERRKSEFRTPVLAAAVGIYLPFQLTAAIFLGGIVAWAADRYRSGRLRSAPGPAASLSEARVTGDRHGLLFAAGLITGEALLGILLAIPIVLAGSADVLAFWGTHDSALPGLVLLLVVMYGMYRVTTGPAREVET